MSTLNVKGSFVFLFCLLIVDAFAQDYSFEQLYKGINEDNSIAVQSKIKTELVYEHKSETSTKGEFLYKKNFNKDGRLVTSRWLDKSINKFVDSEFSYDALNRLVKITNNINSLVYNLDLTVINYSNDDKVASMFHFYGPKESVKMDTLKFYYNSAGQTTHKIMRYKGESAWYSDTTFYTYKDNKLWYTQKKVPKQSRYVISVYGAGLGGALAGVAATVVLWVAMDAIQQKAALQNMSLNTDGCETKIQHPFKTDFIEVQRDSLCNMIHWEYVEEVNGNWTVTEEGNNSYNGKVKTEEKIASSRMSFDKSRAADLKFDGHEKFNYNADGLLQQKCSYKENGKLKRLQKHSYEFFQ